MLPLAMVAFHTAIVSVLAGVSMLCILVLQRLVQIVRTLLSPGSLEKMYWLFFLIAASGITSVCVCVCFLYIEALSTEFMPSGLSSPP